MIVNIAWHDAKDIKDPKMIDFKGTGSIRDEIDQKSWPHSADCSAVTPKKFK